MNGLAYYNEIDPFAAATLRELIADGLIAPGYVDERSIEDVRPDDLSGFVQHHFFAGFGVWSAALRLGGWPDDEPVWTASCPCPPFSAAGPNFRCPECDTRSPVPNAVRTGAFDCIRCGHEWQADESEAFQRQWSGVGDRDGSAVVRLAHTNGGQRIGIADGEGCERDGAQARRLESHGRTATGGVVRIERPGPTNGLWRAADWLGCTDGKWRPVEPGTFPLANAGAFRNRVAELRGAGNAINLAQAAGFIEAVIAHRSTSQVAA